MKHSDLFIQGLNRLTKLHGMQSLKKKKKKKLESLLIKHLPDLEIE